MDLEKNTILKLKYMTIIGVKSNICSSNTVRSAEEETCRKLGIETKIPQADSARLHLGHYTPLS